MRFKVLSNIFAEKSKDDLEKEFIEYQVDQISEEILSEERLDVQWHYISQIQDETTWKSKYQNLAGVMLAILTIFHSNVECERTFSLVTKNKTKYRPNMNTKTLSSFISHKTYMNSTGEMAHNCNPSAQLLRKCKSATYNMLI